MRDLLILKTVIRDSGRKYSWKPKLNLVTNKSIYNSEPVKQSICK